MVLGIGSTSGTETPPVNPPQSSSAPPPPPPPPPVLMGASFYIVPQGPTPFNFPTPSFRWNNNHQYFNFFPTYPGLNPVQPWVQPRNRPETLNFPILRSDSGSGSGSGPILPDNIRTNPGLRFGPYPNPSENHFSENLRTNVELHLGSETNRDENINHPPVPRYGLQTNREEDLSIPILRSGSSSSLSDNLRTNPAPTFRFGSPSNRNEPTFRFGSPSNRNETRSNPVFEIGSSTNPDERRSNPAFEFGSSANPINERRSNPVFEFGSSANPNESRNNPIFGFGSSSNRPEELGSLFRRIGVTINNREENRSSQVVPRFGASPNRDENVGLAAGSNRVENNEHSNRAWAIDMLLEAARPVDQDEVEEPVEIEHEETTESSDESSGDGNSDGDTDDDNDDNTDDETNSEGDGDEEERDEAEGDGELDEERGGEEEEEKEEGEGEDNEVEEELVKTWNLRPRKPTTTKSRIIGSSSRVRARAVRPRAQMEEDRRLRISVSLTKEEIEADFLKMTGEKPPKKPARRPRNEQKRVHMLFPGGWLTTVTRDMYHVPDPLLKP